MRRNLKRLRAELERLKAKARAGDSTARDNLAPQYRLLGDMRRAFHWFRRSAGPHDGHAWLEVGYCRQYGIGTRRDVPAARRSYRQAIKTCYTAEVATEEAQYHLAAALLDAGTPAGRCEAADLLRRAGKDGDYPQATDLLRQLGDGKELRICRCRRYLSRRAGGRDQCALHR